MEPWFLYLSCFFSSTSSTGPSIWSSHTFSFFASSFTLVMTLLFTLVYTDPTTCSSHTFLASRLAPALFCRVVSCRVSSSSSSVLVLLSALITPFPPSSLPSLLSCPVMSCCVVSCLLFTRVYTGPPTCSDHSSPYTPLPSLLSCPSS